LEEAGERPRDEDRLRRDLNTSLLRVASCLFICFNCVLMSDGGVATPGLLTEATNGTTEVLGLLVSEILSAISASFCKSCSLIAAKIVLCVSGSCSINKDLRTAGLH